MNKLNRACKIILKFDQQIQEGNYAQFIIQEN